MEQGTPSALPDLSDNALLQVMCHLEPLNGRSLLARTCTRFRNLARDRRLAIVAFADDSVPSYHWQPCNGLPLGCSSLREAVAHSASGSTIYLEPGIHTLDAHPLWLPHPLKLVGLQHSHSGDALTSVQESHLLHEIGTSNNDCAVIQCKPRGVPALISSTSILLKRVEVRTAVAPCVQQQAGKLTLHDASLLNDPEHPLSSLCSPLERSPASGCASVSASRLEGGARKLLTGDLWSKSSSSPVRELRSACVPSEGILLWFDADAGWAASQNMREQTIGSERKRARNEDDDEINHEDEHKAKRMKMRSAQKKLEWDAEEL